MLVVETTVSSLLKVETANSFEKRVGSHSKAARIASGTALTPR